MTELKVSTEKRRKMQAATYQVKGRLEMAGGAQKEIILALGVDVLLDAISDLLHDHEVLTTERAND